MTGENLGEFSRRDIDTIRVNNALRGELEDILSVIDLKNPDQSSRLSAARALKGSVDSALAERVPSLIETEQSEPVRAALTEALAIYRVAEQGDLGAVLAKILVLVMIILFIQKRPRGLFPQKGRAAEG